MKKNYNNPVINMAVFDSELVATEASGVINSNYKTAESWLEEKANNDDKKVLGIIVF